MTWNRALGLTPQRERDFQAMVVRLARDLGWAASYHTISSFSPPGWPDCFLARPRDGRTLALELKMPTGRLTRCQLAWLVILNRCGVLAAEVRPADWDWLVELLR